MAAAAPVSSHTPYSSRLSEEGVTQREEQQKTKEAFLQFLSSIFALMQERQQPFASCLAQITPDHQTELMTKVVALAAQFNQLLVEKKLDVPPRANDEFEDWAVNVGINSGIFLDSKTVQSIFNVSIPQHLIRYLTVDLKSMSCFDYALCQINDKRALLTDYDNFQVPSILEQWGYTPISEPKPGDIVLYLNEGHPMHLGVYRTSALVQSKWGCENPVAYLHSLENVPASYGNEVVFYRPPSAIAAPLSKYDSSVDKKTTSGDHIPPLLD